MRYRLFPYLYTQFYVASQTGLPIWRPLYFEQPHDQSTWTVDDQFMYGADILVCPKVT